MLAGNNDKVFLPVWRDGRILFFTNIMPANSSRIGYFVAAATEKGTVSVKRTGKAPITGDQLKFCQEIANDGVGLQKFFAAMGAGNLEHFTNALQTQALPYPKTTNPLIFTCLYLDFLRKYAVDNEIIRMYSNSPVSSRFNVERSVGIYKTLSARLQGIEAETLIDADLDHHKKLAGASMSVANLLRECAIVKFDLGKFSDAEEFMLRAVKLHDTNDKWRRLGDFANAAQDRGKTIQYFQKAHNSAPLPAPAALILARCLIEDSQISKAQEFVEIAAKIFVKPAAALQEKIDSAAQTAD